MTHTMTHTMTPTMIHTMVAIKLPPLELGGSEGGDVGNDIISQEFISGTKSIE